MHRDREPHFGTANVEIKLVILQSSVLFDWLTAILPLGGIALSWWSFRFAEDGATPDRWTDYGVSMDYVEEGLQKGMRYRARWSAHLLFATGALLLAAAVPMGAASAHVQDRANLPALGGFAIIALAVIYVITQTFKIWKDRRDDAFSLYYNKDMFFLYDREKTAQIYYRLNPMPLWSLPDRNWFASRKLPDIDEIFARAAKTARCDPQGFPEAPT